MAIHNALTTQRILSIDALRGITILVMIFVNELAGVQGIPLWMKHMTADVDAMTFVDMVFPAFLFIVGMSIPFAINNRLSKGDSVWQLQLHILVRTIGLLVLGVFMVNAEGGYNEQAMGMPIALWSLLFYAGVILLWNVYTFQSNVLRWLLRSIGLVLLIVLAFLYRGGEDGSQTLTPQWWGILGLIGWAYLVTCIIYQLAGGRLQLVLTGLAGCIIMYIVAKSDAAENSPVIAWVSGQTGHIIHTAIALCGVMVSLFFFDQRKKQENRIRFILAIVFAGILFGVGYILRPYYTISKIYATPTWALYSAAVCALLFAFLYWLIDLRKISGWTAFFKPAASNPLLTYSIPFILYALMKLAGIHWPEQFYQGAMGILWSAVYAVAVMAVVIGLNKLKIRLQL
jgi:heparan-alpha-glucosaminide N-acetyltransferase